eukprot:1749696-Rhodomonas_salina.2
MHTWTLHRPRRTHRRGAHNTCTQTHTSTHEKDRRSMHLADGVRRQTNGSEGMGMGMGMPGMGMGQPMMAPMATPFGVAIGMKTAV